MTYEFEVSSDFFLKYFSDPKLPSIVLVPGVQFWELSCARADKDRGAQHVEGGACGCLSPPGVCSRESIMGRRHGAEHWEVSQGEMGEGPSQRREKSG